MNSTFSPLGTGLGLTRIIYIHRNDCIFGEFSAKKSMYMVLANQHMLKILVKCIVIKVASVLSPALHSPAPNKFAYKVFLCSCPIVIIHLPMSGAQPGTHHVCKRAIRV